MSSAVIEEFKPAPSIADVLLAFADEPDVVLFHSALQRPSLGRYSFLSSKPFESFVLDEPQQGLDPFRDVRQRMAEFSTDTISGLPPFQGGAAGLLSYEFGRFFERLPEPRWNEFGIPAAVISLYDWVLAWDHHTSRCWFIGQGYPEKSTALRQAAAREKLRHVQKRLVNSPGNLFRSRSTDGINILSPQQPVAGVRGLVSNFTREEYLQAVERVIEYIRAGDLFQANLSQRLLFPATTDPVTQYLALQRTNPAPFAAYFAHEDCAVLSSSPERFLQLEGEMVSTRPIKGTRRRRPVAEADLFTRDELRESEKDRAENVMIVDLLRNDLSRVCRPGSLRVPELCTVETYETVTHLVSEVRGQLQEGATFWDALQATFPGGSITGAPKIRAMEVITELEQVARGPYCGSLFYYGFDGTADSSILIRTITQRGGWLSLPAGGGIIAQSDPLLEYQETLHKAQGMLRALPMTTENSQGGRRD